jgi:hypothetical protein
MKRDAKDYEHKNRVQIDFPWHDHKAIVVGVVSIALQFLPDGELIAFMLSVAVLGTLIQD